MVENTLVANLKISHARTNASDAQISLKSSSVQRVPDPPGGAPFLTSQAGDSNLLELHDGVAFALRRIHASSMRPLDRTFAVYTDIQRQQVVSAEQVRKSGGIWKVILKGNRAYFSNVFANNRSIHDGTCCMS